MTFRRRQLLGWAALAAAALAGGWWLAHLDLARRVSTDVLDLVPDHGAAPELALVRQLAGEAEARTMLLELTIDGRPAPAAAAVRFAAELRAAPAFDQAVALGDTTARDAIGAALFEHRMALLFPRWLHRHAAAADASSATLAREAATELGRFLEKTEALAFQELVPADPLLLLPGTLAEAKGGLAFVQAGAGAPALVWARLSASPLSEAGQGPAFAAIEQARAGGAREFPGLAVAYTGVNRFAAASRARIEGEVRWLNLASILAVLAVALAFIRQVWRGLHLVPVILLSVLGAWVGTTLAFPRVHVLVFVFGSLLSGVAIDYGFYLFMQPPLRPDEDYPAKVRRLAQPLLASCLTTVAGFALLVFSELPFIRQLGVFVGTGLLCALGAALVYFATVRRPFLETRAFGQVPVGAPALRRRLRRVLPVAWLLALPGLALLRWKDDIRELEIPSPALHAEDARLRAQFGEQAAGTTYVTYGRDLGEARAALARFEQWLGTAAPGSSTFGLGLIVPTDDEVAAAGRFFRDHPDFPGQLRSALEAAGFDAASFEPFFAAYARAAQADGPAATAAAFAAVQGVLTGPAGLLVHAGKPLSWFITVAHGTPAAAPPAELQTVSTGQLQSLNRVFAQYRQSALRLSAIGLAVVGLGVFLTYGLRDGWRIFAIPCGACLGLFGLLGWAGQPLNLFHLLGAFLGVCLTHNYSIFSATSAYRREPPPVSVRLSALTTAASFGVLALSGIPVVRALGVTVAAMVIGALLVIELEHLSALGEKP